VALQLILGHSPYLPEQPWGSAPWICFHIDTTQTCIPSFEYMVKTRYVASMPVTKKATRIVNSHGCGCCHGNNATKEATEIVDIYGDNMVGLDTHPRGLVLCATSQLPISDIGRASVPMKRASSNASKKWDGA